MRLSIGRSIFRNSIFSLSPVVTRRVSFLATGAVVAFASAWTGTQTGMAQQTVNQWERDRLALSINHFNEHIGTEQDPWAPVMNHRWSSVAKAMEWSAVTPKNATYGASDLPKNPNEASKFLKRFEGRRWIEIDLSSQSITAWEGGKAIKSVTVSTGKRSTPTPTGVWQVQTKLRSTRMRGPGYDTPNVPYTMYYYRGYAVHGAYWHSRFGTPVSHGCTNLPVAQARWFYNWTPHAAPVVVRR
ncbi:MAG: L,D-transpeptidase [Cyanophyceae cyanobacterium]